MAVFFFLAEMQRMVWKLTATNRIRAGCRVLLLLWGRGRPVIKRMPYFEKRFDTVEGKMWNWGRWPSGWTRNKFSKTRWPSWTQRWYFCKTLGVLTRCRAVPLRQQIPVQWSEAFKVQHTNPGQAGAHWLSGKLETLLNWCMFAVQCSVQRKTTR